MYSCSLAIDATRTRVIATGDVVQPPRWDDTPNGRRPVAGSTAVDEETGQPINLIGVLLPTGQNGEKETHTVRVCSYEVPELPEFEPVEFDGLQALIRPAKTGKGIELYLSADAVRVASASAKPAPAAKDTAPKDVA
ncbi:hypothetical protein PHK61_06555 [Actinomycetospora lutea]|uniref:hypothetical protein n=1 Tax=Actinomycetospora lutea TaxID=663604 RepID=UPI002366FD1B|nr:hypothetical protein [Actinomycetospora lutea]MDD7938076.1 hypothetical protein [Actinomycetospora lutea]